MLNTDRSETFFSIYKKTKQTKEFKISNSSRKQHFSISLFERKHYKCRTFGKSTKPRKPEIDKKITLREFYPVILYMDVTLFTNRTKALSQIVQQAGYAEPKKQNSSFQQ